MLRALMVELQAYLGGVAGSIPRHYHKANITIK